LKRGWPERLGHDEATGASDTFIQRVGRLPVLN
jgi:hypothetical protein